MQVSLPPLSSFTAIAVPPVDRLALPQGFQAAMYRTRSRTPAMRLRPSVIAPLRPIASNHDAQES
jgi:hypothetical protein